MAHNLIIAPAGISNDLPIEHYEYDLPDDLIAQVPLPVRHESKLLQVDKQTGSLYHRHFLDLPELLLPGDLLVTNNTRVIPARVVANRSSGGRVKLLLLHSLPERPHVFEALVTPIKRLKPGEQLLIHTPDGTTFALTIADIVSGIDGHKRLLVDLGNTNNVFTLLSQIGQTPLPPYIRRTGLQLHELDQARYQTVFAVHPGAVACPTAGLHFSDVVLSLLEERGIETAQITLHVGPGTFKPIAASLVEHRIEPESFHISAQAASAIAKAQAEKRRIIAVGTTTLRALETAGASQPVAPITNGTTSLFIKPGFQFKVASGLITNFHVSRSSLIVLVAAFQAAI